jgi:hypothetical protein
MSMRDKMRAATLGTTARFRRELVRFADRDGELVECGEADEASLVVEVRQPTVAQRSDIMRAAGIRDDAGSADFGRLQARAAVACCFVPAEDSFGSPATGGTEPLFSVEDMPALLARPAGSWVDTLGARAMALMNVKADDVGKASAPIQSGS